MLDFLSITTKSTKRGVVEIYPKFIIKKTKDLMIRGGDFYAVWVEKRGLWSTDENDALELIDAELTKFAKDNSQKFDANIKVMYMWDAESGMIDSWHKYCQKQMRDHFHMLDEKLIFSNTPTNKGDYASKRLSYPLEVGDFSSYDKLMSTLYSENERRKIEWCIGSIVSGDSKTIQKFCVLYGAAGTGKSTVLNIIQQLFEGYYSVFDAKALGSSSNMFALESFKSNPLVAIQHDGDLSRIEDNTRLNSLTSHEMMTVNEKFKSTYSNKFKSFLFMGTNKPVKITDGKSGIIRRLIDVTPTGNKVSQADYKQLVHQISFELGAIAMHCLEVYENDKTMWDCYIPLTMLGATNDFYNFIEDSYLVFKREDSTTLKAAWEMYKLYCEDAKVPFPMSKKNFREELKNYFRDYNESDGIRTYGRFRLDKFENNMDISNKKPSYKIDFIETESIFDREYSNCPAQYSNDNGIPFNKWDKVKTTLKDIDTHKLHYVKVPENHIVIDFDIKGKDGLKSYERNLEEASKWPPTYSELSKSGLGIHLHYIYDGDVSKLSRVYDENIEVKIFNGNSSLRRLLTKCNTLPITTINTGLPLKGDDKLVNSDTIKSEKSLRILIKRNLNKEIHPATKPSIDFIFKILEDAYESGLKYDISDWRNHILSFAANSTNNSEYCIKLVSQMKFKSDEPSTFEDNNGDVIFYDVEVFPNLFLINWKLAGEDKKVVRMINPKPSDIEVLLKYRLIGFNCRRYDNHILYGALLGYSNDELFKLSQKIINDGFNCFFGEAYNLSYTDVYDFSSKKQSLKKWEIELGISHKELGLPWDKPVPKEMWEKVAEYCDNDVIATEKVFNHLKGDWTARQILADLAGMSVNDTTNSLTTKIIFGNEKKPNLIYTDLSTGEQFDSRGDSLGESKDIINKFDGYEYVYSDKDKSFHNIYRNTDVGKGGYVYAEPGIYGNVALLDVQSMHPNSAINLNIFGKYTKNFKEILDARVDIKQGYLDEVRNMFAGKLAKYLDDESTSKDLAFALKIAINSVYGLTSASFDNPFRDIRNKNNIVALRGALFMRTLQDEVQKRGFTVAHIKTDSIKIPDATPEIIQFVMDFGKEYGYIFEHEATYERMCLVNDAVYIAKYKDGKKAGKWTATGTQFQVPYVFKTIFSKEPITFDDLCETKSASTALYLDMNEQLPNVDIFDKVRVLRKADELSISKKDRRLLEEYSYISDEELENKITQGHDYNFIGKVGRFCPIKDGRGGGLLVAERHGKYFAVSGSKGYRWMESEMVKSLGKEEDINMDYYKNMVSDAIEAISLYGDYSWFVSDDPYISPKFEMGEFMNKPIYKD